MFIRLIILKRTRENSVSDEEEDVDYGKKSNIKNLTQEMTRFPVCLFFRSASVWFHVVTSPVLD